MAVLAKQNRQRGLEELTTKIHHVESTLGQEFARAKESEACLIVIRGDRQGHRYFLQKETVELGRDATVDIFLRDIRISRHHAKISQNAAGLVTIEDLGSSNGTMVNGQRLEPGRKVVLTKEDVIEMGDMILKFIPAGELEIALYNCLGAAIDTDPLTQTYNKSYLLEALRTQVCRARVGKTTFSILFFDIDYFKRINDNYGHSAGDFVLINFAALIAQQYIRKEDIFARYGGEEFVILLGNVDIQQAIIIAERIRKSIAMHCFEYEGKQLPITTSIGVAEFSLHMSAEDLLKTADKALYDAKNSGRNRVGVGFVLSSTAL